MVAESQNWRLVKSETECWVVRGLQWLPSSTIVMYANRHDPEASRIQRCYVLAADSQQVPSRPWNWQVGVGMAKSNGSVEGRLR